MPSKRTHSPPSLSRNLYTDDPAEDDEGDDSRSNTHTRARSAQHTPDTARPTNTDPLPSPSPSPEPPNLAIRPHSSSASSSFYLIEPRPTNPSSNPFSFLAAAMARTQQWVNDRLRLNTSTQQSYQTIPNQIIDPESYRPVSPRLRALRDDDQSSVAGSVASSEAEIKRLHDEHGKLSYFEYAIFVFLGIAMLWSWNMFMACATYFQRRFVSNDWISNNFQSLILVVSTSTNLFVMLDLSKRQIGANYPFRICTSLFINCVLFVILALSTVIWIVDAVPYLVFTLVCVFIASMSAGFSQNGVFSFVSRFGESYTQAIMTGQGIAGVLPAVAQIVSVLLVPTKLETEDPSTSTGITDDTSNDSGAKSAFIYFLTATVVSGICFLLFLSLLRRHNITIFQASDDNTKLTNDPDSEESEGVSLLVLFGKLKYLCFGIWLDFAATMTFPVFTSAIYSVSPSAGRLYSPEVFIPLGFLLWNLGDLSGRVCCGFKRFQVTNPTVLATASVLRLGFIPLYFMCNVRGEGAVLGDGVYWVLQVLFGFTNGWIGSCCMMAAPGLVEEEEKEATGGFMGLWLVMGLTCGSLMSFALGV